MIRESRSLEVTDSAIASVYANVVNSKGKDKEHYLALMTDQTFFDSDSALAEGLSTDIDSTKQASSNTVIPFKKGEYLQFMQSHFTKGKEPKPIDHTRANEMRRKFMADQLKLAEIS